MSPTSSFTYRTDGPLFVHGGGQCCDSGYTQIELVDADEQSDALTMKVTITHGEGCEFWRFIPTTGEATD